MQLCACYICYIDPTPTIPAGIIRFSMSHPPRSRELARDPNPRASSRRRGNASVSRRALPYSYPRRPEKSANKSPGGRPVRHGAGPSATPAPRHVRRRTSAPEPYLPTRPHRSARRTGTNELMVEGSPQGRLQPPPPRRRDADHRGNKTRRLNPPLRADRCAVDVRNPQVPAYRDLCHPP